ncbi:hypothetical protein AJ80_08605 [Polytolypa hystricis UAMH7299]|uniref:Peptidoglycan recognition protein family domain-containing protein n=1 Tax=Polytolypa hystricis (strain UAMH7299) TaxID=1447883 RepID=A0A2B7X542_POLH7|nr:hypothetical protein AJ80_08605 [Polytolypa hystricis UAMH7299]
MRISNGQSRRRGGVRISTRILLFALLACLLHSAQAIKFVSRKGWGARSPKRNWDPISNPKGVKIHYLGTPFAPIAHSKCAGAVREVQNFQMDKSPENYFDIAYNLAVCPHGHVYEGRPAGYYSGANGGATLNAQHYAVVAMVGSSGLTTPTKAQIQGIKDAISYLRSKGAGNEIKGHRDGYDTQCPGGPLYDLVKSGALNPGGSSKSSTSNVKPATHTNSNTGNGVVAFPGANFFRSQPSSWIITAMGKRLVAEGCNPYRVGPGPQWTTVDKSAYSCWQKKLGYRGKDADGWPGKKSWDKLKVKGNNGAQLVKV